jgi:hypothetical protein
MPVSQALGVFTLEGLALDPDYAVHVEQVRSVGKVPRYLAKLGCELAGMHSKLGHVGKDGVVHYGVWQLANIAADPRHPLHDAARGAWRELYLATYGSQTLTFSQEARTALGIDGARDEEIPQEAPQVTEDTRCAGQIDGVLWDSLARDEQHGLLARIYQAHKAGTLETLDFLQPAGGVSGMFRAVEPPEPEVAPTWWQRWLLENAAADRAEAPERVRRRNPFVQTREQQYFAKQRELIRELQLGKRYEQASRVAEQLAWSESAYDLLRHERTQAAERARQQRESRPRSGPQKIEAASAHSEAARDLRMPITARRKEPAEQVLPGLGGFVKPATSIGPPRPRKGRNRA